MNAAGRETGCELGEINCELGDRMSAAAANWVVSAAGQETGCKLGDRMLAASRETGCELGG